MQMCIIIIMRSFLFMTALSSTLREKVTLGNQSRQYYCTSYNTLPNTSQFGLRGSTNAPHTTRYQTLLVCDFVTLFRFQAKHSIHPETRTCQEPENEALTFLIISKATNIICQLKSVTSKPHEKHTAIYIYLYINISLS